MGGLRPQAGEGGPVRCSDHLPRPRASDRKGIAWPRRLPVLGRLSSAQISRVGAASGYRPRPERAFLTSDGKLENDSPIPVGVAVFCTKSLLPFLLTRIALDNEVPPP